MSDDARSIVAAGRIAAAGEAGPARGAVEERLPNIAFGPDGDPRLVYLERRNGEAAWRLRSAGIGFDPRTGRPTVVDSDDVTTPEPSQELQPAALLVSLDGATVFGRSRSGQVAVLPLGRSGRSTKH
jgi:hypothetical protein